VFLTKFALIFACRRTGEKTGTNSRKRLGALFANRRKCSEKGWSCGGVLQALQQVLHLSPASTEWGAWCQHLHLSPIYFPFSVGRFSVSRIVVMSVFVSETLVCATNLKLPIVLRGTQRSMSRIILVMLSVHSSWRGEFGCSLNEPFVLECR
jgi:hypothetical protein